MENDTFELALERLTEEVRNTLEVELKKRYVSMAIIAVVLMAGIFFLVDSLILSNARAELESAKRAQQSVSQKLDGTVKNTEKYAKLVTEAQMQFEQDMTDASQMMTALSRKADAFQKEVKAVTDSSLLALAEVVDELKNVSDILEKTISHQMKENPETAETIEAGETEGPTESPQELIERIQTIKKSLIRVDSSISAGLKVTEEW